MSNIASTSKRPDGRSPKEIRPLLISTGHLDRSDGSAKFSFGSTSALASFSGPIEVRLREELVDRATLEIVHRPLEGVGATPSRALITSLESILPPILKLKQHPRSLLQLIVQSLTPSLPAPKVDPSEEYYNSWPQPQPQSPTSLSKSSSSTSTPSGITYASKAACINASTLSILDAGSISTTGVVVAIALASTVDNGLVLDPSAQEEGEAISRFVFAWVFGVGFGSGLGGSDLDSSTPRGNEMEVDDHVADENDESKIERLGMELVFSESEGEFTRDEFHAALDESRAGCRKILETIRSTMEDKLVKR